jgi:transcriptional regulator with XRE-family HTH domain
MKKITPIINRLKHILNAKTDRELTEKLGISYSTLDTWKNRDKIPEKRLLEFSLRYQVPFDWLLTGEGEMYKKENNDNINQESTENNNINDSIKNFPADIQLILEELLQMDKAKRKKILKTILSMEE